MSAFGLARICWGTPLKRPVGLIVLSVWDYTFACGIELSARCSLPSVLGLTLVGVPRVVSPRAEALCRSSQRVSEN
ncbi:hypothetical protein C8Q80DRAFT_1195030 [Daedaleopsis nitida]|nr:hypothetical protein C8Q80DRAFT_1195030 [Daedaleopsis nitida]